MNVVAEKIQVGMVMLGRDPDSGGIRITPRDFMDHNSDKSNRLVGTSPELQYPVIHILLDTNCHLTIKCIAYPVIHDPAL